MLWYRYVQLPSFPAFLTLCALPASHTLPYPTRMYVPTGLRLSLQELSKVSDTPINIAPLCAPAPSPFLTALPSQGEEVVSLPSLPPRASADQDPPEVPGARSSRGNHQRRMGSNRNGPPGASPTRTGSALLKLAVPRTESGCNLAAEAFVRAVPLACAAGPERTESVNDGPVAEALQQAKLASKQPAGSVLLITLMYV